MGFKDLSVTSLSCLVFVLIQKEGVSSNVVVLIFVYNGYEGRVAYRIPF